MAMKERLPKAGLAEDGVHLNVPGRVLVEQIRARIAWHRQARDRISTELRAIGESPEKASTNWMLRFRRNDNERSLAEHEEVLRYLAFLERQIVPRRIYRLSGHELFSMNLMPR